MVKIKFSNRIYKIDKNKLLFVLSKLKSRKIKENEIEKIMKECGLYKKMFLNNVQKI